MSNPTLARWLFRTLEPIAKHAGIVIGSPLWDTARVLLASVRLATTDEVTLAEAVKVSPAFVARVAARCRKERIWRGGMVRAKWMDREEGDFAFLLDAMVACGYLARPAAPNVTARNTQQRAKRVAEGRCTRCGGPRDGGVVCARCKTSVAESAKRRKHGSRALTALKTVETFYQYKDGGSE